MQIPDKSTQTLAIHINGIVQGVGFRPFVYKLATSLKLAGTVSNSGNGVYIIVTGSISSLTDFTQRVQLEAPPMADISSLATEELPTTHTHKQFDIVDSQHQSTATVPITPDIAICSDCLQEIRDPHDRRWGYPFTNCTNCGPRFTIVEKVPYDRPNTSMRHFPMGAHCEQEYNDPLDRRFHAQPNACPTCGPQLSWHDQNGQEIATKECIGSAAQALTEGRIVAIKGLGGFHLAADATSTEAVALLRLRKKRPDKPLAIMVGNEEEAKRFCTISKSESNLLTSPQHPIVLLEKNGTHHLADNLADGLGVLGVMLAYTPLHALLLGHPAGPDALVMTSGNPTGEPICTQNREALQRLQSFADFFLLHNRNIVTRVDDSIARITGGKTRLLRRGRGYSPVPIPLLAQTSDILACGAEMKNTFCIVRNNEAYLSQHIGELSHLACFDFYTESIRHLQTILECTPQATACDLHPDYPSTRYASRLQTNLTPVQHHHAHTCAVMAEHGLEQPVLSVVLDGTGFGDDSTIFGGEIYIADRKGYQREGHLSHLPLPGGDKAAQEPWRMALALLFQSFGSQGLNLQTLPSWLQTVDQYRRDTIGQMLEKNINSPFTSSCGRLFDAVAALIGTCLHATYEGQAAMLLEQQAQSFAVEQQVRTRESSISYKPGLTKSENMWVLDALPLAQWILEDLNQEISPQQIAYRFHWWLIHGIGMIVEKVRKKYKINTIVLCGGSMQNKLLFEGLDTTLRGKKLMVYSGEKIPVNDGGIALGQAYIGGAQQEEELAEPSAPTLAC